LRKSTKQSPYADGRIACEGSDNFPDPDVLALKTGEDLDLRLEQFEPSSILETESDSESVRSSPTQLKNFPTLDSGFVTIGLPGARSDQ